MPPESDQCSASDEEAPFRCEISRDGRAARLRVLGALDLATVSSLAAEVAELRDAGLRRLVLDLSGLKFMDSTGLRCILDMDAAARQDGFSVALVRGPRAVQRVFDVTGTAAHLRFIDD
jgi:anti-sigma B factor antagonist